MAEEYFLRFVQVNIEGAAGGFKWSSDTGLRVTFSAKFTAKKRPNGSKVTLYNLSPESRRFIEEEGTDLTLTAGYRNGRTATVIKGQVSYAVSHRKGTEVITEVTVKDGGIEYRSGSFSKSYAEGTTTRRILEDILTQSNLGRGYGVKDFPAVAYPEPWAFKGKLRRVLDIICSDAGGYEWSIQNGNLQLLAPGDGGPDFDLVLNPESGLLSVQPKKGGISATCLLAAELRPGHDVFIQSTLIYGAFHVRTVTHTGDSVSAEGKHQTQIEARRIKGIE